MELNNVKALVPANEDFDASAVNEGVWLSEGHLNAIETELGNNATLVGELKNTIAENATAISTANQAVTDAEAKLATANETITAHESTIQSLNEQIVALKANPAGEGHSTSKEKDDLNNGGAEIVSEVTQEAAKLRALRDKK